MVRPNQVIGHSENELTFIMFAQTKEQVKRRVLFINFPSTIIDVIFRGETVDEHIKSINVISEGKVNRYAVTVDLKEI